MKFNDSRIAEIVFEEFDKIGFYNNYDKNNLKKIILSNGFSFAIDNINERIKFENLIQNFKEIYISISEMELYFYKDINPFDANEIVYEIKNINKLKILKNLQKL